MLDLAGSLSCHEDAAVHGFNPSQWYWYRANSGPEQRELLVEWITSPLVTSGRTKYLIGQDYWPPNLFMDLEPTNARNSDVEDEWGVYGIAGVSQMPGDMLEYFNYEGSARGSYDNHGHVGLLARMHHHLDKLELTHDEILAGRESGSGSPIQYVHELCSRAKSQFQMYKLASFPIVVNASALQMQMKQMAIFMEQVYLIYFGNYSGTPHTQAILNRLRPEEMPTVQGIGANRQLPMYEGMLAGGVDMISSSVLQCLVKSYFRVHGVTELNRDTFADIFSQYHENGNGHYTRGPLDTSFKRQVTKGQEDQ